MDTARHLALAVAIACAAGCGASRAGWGKGAWRGLHESGELQVRRALVRLDPATNELVLPWVGARVPVGIEGEILACELVIYRDADGDRALDDGEALTSRASPQPGVKVLFQALRLPAPTDGVELVGRLLVVTRTESRIEQFLFRDESGDGRR